MPHRKGRMSNLYSIENKNKLKQKLWTVHFIKKTTRHSNFSTVPTYRTKTNQHKRVTYSAKSVFHVHRTSNRIFRITKLTILKYLNSSLYRQLHFAVILDLRKENNNCRVRIHPTLGIDALALKLSISLNVKAWMKSFLFVFNSEYIHWLLKMQNCWRNIQHIF